MKSLVLNYSVFIVVYINEIIQFYWNPGANIRMHQVCFLSTSILLLLQLVKQNYSETYKVIYKRKKRYHHPKVITIYQNETVLLFLAEGRIPHLGPSLTCGTCMPQSKCHRDAFPDIGRKATGALMSLNQLCSLVLYSLFLILWEEQDKISFSKVT